jgi:hypothetical protein
MAPSVTLFTRSVTLGCRRGTQLGSHPESPPSHPTRCRRRTSWRRVVTERRVVPGDGIAGRHERRLTLDTLEDETGELVGLACLVVDDVGDVPFEGAGTGAEPGAVPRAVTLACREASL